VASLVRGESGLQQYVMSLTRDEAFLERAERPFPKLRY
jgi:hypothetical protein